MGRVECRFAVKPYPSCIRVVCYVLIRVVGVCASFLIVQISARRVLF